MRELIDVAIALSVGLVFFALTTVSGASRKPVS
jgi:hypothetical protein